MRGFPSQPPRRPQPSPAGRRLRRRRQDRPGGDRPAPSRCSGRQFPWRRSGNEHRLRRDTAGPALPSVETVGYGHDRQTRHRNPAQPGRRRSAVCGLGRTGQEQWTACVGFDRRGQRPPVGRSCPSGGDVDGVRTSGSRTWTSQRRPRFSRRNVASEIAWLSMSVCGCRERWMHNQRTSVSA